MESSTHKASARLLGASPSFPFGASLHKASFISLQLMLKQGTKNELYQIRYICMIVDC